MKKAVLFERPFSWYKQIMKTDSAPQFIKNYPQVVAIFCFLAGLEVFLSMATGRAVVNASMIWPQDSWFSGALIMMWGTAMLLVVLFPMGLTRFQNAAILMGVACFSHALLVWDRAGVSSTVRISTLLLLLMDMGVLGFLLLIMHHRYLEMRWALLYVFNPFIVYALLTADLTDVAGLSFFMGALYWATIRQWRFMYIFMGSAVFVNPAAALGAIFLINPKNLKHAVWALVTVFIAGCIQLLMTPESISGPGTNAELGFYNPVYILVQALSNESIRTVSIYDGIMAAGLVIGCWYFHPHRNRRFGNDPIPGCFFVFGALVLLAPVIQVSSLIWMAPLLVVRPALSWVVLMMTIPLGLPVLSGINDLSESLQLTRWTQLTMWLPVCGLLCNDGRLFFKRQKLMTQHEQCQSVSVVVPTLNEEKNIIQCLSEICKNRHICEAIVVDGGSTDHTRKLAQNAGARVILHEKGLDCGGGRGGQIKAGIDMARGDVVAVVHADTLLSSDVLQEMVAMLNRNPTVIGGAAGCRFQSSAGKLRLIEFLNDARAAFSGISFGDQVQFFRRRPVADHDLFPDMPLMEDVEFSVRLHRLGRQVYLFKHAADSARRWQRMGSANALLIIRLLAVYLIQRLWTTPDSTGFYRKYYQKDKAR